MTARTIPRITPVLLGALLLTHVAIESAGGEEGGPVTEVAVHVAKLTRATVRSYVTVYGTVEPAPATAERPAAMATLAAPAGGLLSEAAAVEGGKVAAGARLFLFDTRAADAAVEKAQAGVQFAEQTLARQRKLVAIDGTSQKSVMEAEQQAAAAQQELKTAQTARALLEVTAPIGGTVTRVFVRAGEAVEAGRPLATLMDGSRLVVSAQVPAREVAALKIGQPAEIKAAGAENTIEGTLIYVASEADGRTGMVLARIRLPAACGLLPGQFVTARITSEARENRLVAPVQSVIRSPDGGRAVAVIVEDHAQWTPVKTGLTDGGVTEIEGEKLDENTTIVTQEAYGLPRETKVRIVTP